MFHSMLMAMSVDSQGNPRFQGTTPCWPRQKVYSGNVSWLRNHWYCRSSPLATAELAVLMFLASTLNIRFRKSEYIGLAVIGSGHQA